MGSLFEDHEPPPGQTTVPLAEQVLLADELVQAARAHPHRERLLGQWDRRPPTLRFLVLEERSHATIVAMQESADARR